ncbi:MAG: nucleotide sugar dehydrogenase [Treponema sp.]|jgi:UDPglucose 6-dehydrogenase|nr:nucleotide sugar dehydrogenase [Treponema sp.]
MKITVTGMGYVGLANALLLARHNDVTAYDISPDKVDAINNRQSPIRDREIEDFLKDEEIVLCAVSDAEKAYTGADCVIIATPTDYDPDRNFFNTSSVESVIRDIERFAPAAVVVIKSTVPVGFTEKMRRRHQGLTLLFSPEFLREGKALYDNLYPSRIIVGGLTPEAMVFGNLMLQGAVKKDAPVCYMSPTEAEAVKLFSNTFLALRVAFFNELDTYAEMKSLDSKSIIEGVCLDPRIGNYYNNPSFGYGGYCLPKDTRQLKANYRHVPNNLITAIVEANQTRKLHIAAMIMRKEIKTAGIYKLAMKTDADNFRSSAVIEIMEQLKRRHVSILVFDPAVKEDRIFDCPVLRDFEEFKSRSDIIIANRVSAELIGVKNKVYTRDVFSRD